MNSAITVLSLILTVFFVAVAAGLYLARKIEKKDEEKTQKVIAKKDKQAEKEKNMRIVADMEKDKNALAGSKDLSALIDEAIAQRIKIEARKEPPPE
jgi:uncharacterized protein HemX